MANSVTTRRSASKRTENVSIYDSDTSTDNSFDEDSYEMPTNAKVRNNLSIKSLLKRSKSTKVGDDHVYTKIGTRTIEEKSQNVRGGMRKRKIACEIDLGSKRMKCDSKNAIMARLNRERKKQYVSSLESDIKDLEAENNDYKTKVTEQDALISKLQKEVKYLTSLLANSKDIRSILDLMNKSTGLPVTSSLCLQPEPSRSPEQGYGSSADDCEYQLNARTKSVISGSNFPITANDVNLGGSPLDDAFDPELQVGSPLFPFEEDDLGLFDFNVPMECNQRFEMPQIKSEAGICLHVNSGKISMEFCSLCSEKAHGMT